MNRKRRKTKIGGQFAARLIEMLESPAYRALSQSAHRILARLEIEHGHHAGSDNGRLPVTFGDFEKYGMDPHSIAPAQREVQALGFAEITERGRPSKSDFGRHPHHWRLTYLQDLYGHPPTHEWRRHKTIEEARRVSNAARKAKDEKAVAKSKEKATKKQTPGVGNSSEPGWESHPAKAKRPRGESHRTAAVENPTVPSISPEDRAA